MTFIFSCWKRGILPFISVILISLIAAAPPNPDPTLGPFFKGLKQPRSNASCCDLSDCRTVNYRMTAEGYEVYIDRNTFPGGPNEWIKVPKEVVLPPQTNPTGEGIACWAVNLGLLCFLQATGT